MPDMLAVETLPALCHLPVCVHAPCLHDAIFSFCRLVQLSESCSGWRAAPDGLQDGRTAVQGSPPARGPAAWGDGVCGGVPTA